GEGLPCVMVAPPKDLWLTPSLSLPAWQQVEQQLDGSQPGESGRGPVQYAEKTPNPVLTSKCPGATCGGGTYLGTVAPGRGEPPPAPCRWIG
uniref:Uncharacterized protein n=1 Tax=Gopherus evgoodei TaxID=1825980 RepID=A0A8C4VW15_9SAUR